MKPRCSKKRNAAITLLEIGVVIVMLAILAAVLLPFLAATKRKSSRIGCNGNLKQIGLAYRIWAGDNNDVFPMGVSVAVGGTMELVRAGDVAATFQAMSNELSTPKILVCPGDGIDPGDTSRTRAIDFGTLSNSNISYFVGVDVTNCANPQMLLSGDSNFQIAGIPTRSGLVNLKKNTSFAWASGWHLAEKPYFWMPTKFAGNIGFADGSVQRFVNSDLPNLIRQTGIATNRLAIP